MAKKLEEQILSFGEVPDPHTIVTIAYGSVRVAEKDLYSQIRPIDPIQQVIGMLQQQTLAVKGDGVKNITISIVPVEEEGVRFLDYYGYGTIFKLKR